LDDIWNLQYVVNVKYFSASILRERELTFSEMMLQRDFEKYIGSKNEGSLISWHFYVERDGTKIAEVGDPSIVRWRSTWFEKSSISQTPLKLSLDMNFLPAIGFALFLFFFDWQCVLAIRASK